MTGNQTYPRAGTDRSDGIVVQRIDHRGLAVVVPAIDLAQQVSRHFEVHGVVSQIMEMDRRVPRPSRETRYPGIQRMPF